MALSTYAELKVAVADWLNRSDLESQIPDFIRLFEAWFDADLRTATHRRRICRSSAEISNEYESLPSNYLSIQSMALDLTPQWRLENISPEELVNRKQTEDAWIEAIENDTEVIPAPPKYWAIVGTEVRYFPPPTQTYTNFMTVYERLEVLADDTDANWLLTYYPHCYLWGALMQAAPFLGDDERVATWAGLLDQAMNAVTTADPLPADPNVIRADTPPLRPATSSATFRP